MSEFWIFGASKPVGIALRDSSIDASKTVSFSRTSVEVAGEHQESVIVDFSDHDKLRTEIRERIPSTGALKAAFCQRYRAGAGQDDITAIHEGLDVELAPILILLDEVREAGRSNDLSVVLMSSVAGRLTHEDVPFWYHVLKSMTLTATKVLAAKGASSGVRVNCVMLGEFEKHPRESYTDDEREKFSTLEAFTLGQRLCTKGDIVNLADFLLSDRAKYITGQVIALDGGLSDISQESIIRRVLANGDA